MRLQGNPMQEPSGIFNPLPADNEDEAESRMQRALVSYMPEPQQQQQHHHQHHQQHQQLQQRRGSSSPDPPAGPSKGRSVVELSQDILHYVQSKVGPDLRLCRPCSRRCCMLSQLDPAGVSLLVHQEGRCLASLRLS